MCMMVLTACSADVKQELEQLPDDYSLENARADNCVVFENGDITSGQSEWDRFIKATEKGEADSVRLGFYYTLDPSRVAPEYYEEVKDEYPVLYMVDLSYSGEKYAIESFQEGAQICREYRHLMKYEGEPSSRYAAFSSYTFYVLIDDSSLTWEDIERRMLSSDAEDWIDYYLVYSDLVFK